MPQIRQLLTTLKQSLKAHGLTYADVARHLDMSEANVKRAFSEEKFSLQRLEAVCELMDMEISDLVRAMTEQQETRIDGLSEAQEHELVSDVSLLLVTVLVLNRWTFDDILNNFRLDQHKLIRLLARLDRLKLIDLLPGNRVKLKVSRNFAWLENGPIQQFFREKIERDFFDSRFDHEHECLLVGNGMLAAASNARFQRRLERLLREFDELSDQDAGLPLGERYGATLIVALRRWRYGLFDGLRRKD